MMGRLSLRARTTVLAVLVFGAAAVAAGYLLITVMYDALVAEVDRSVSSRAADIGAQVISDNEEIVLGAGLGADTFAMVFTTEGLVYDSTDPTVEPPEVFVTIKGLGETFDADLRSAGTFGSDNLRATAILTTGRTERPWSAKRMGRWPLMTSSSMSARAATVSIGPLTRRCGAS
jgi:hypothetical protein